MADHANILSISSNTYGAHERAQRQIFLTSVYADLSKSFHRYKYHMLYHTNDNILSNDPN